MEEPKEPKLVTRLADIGETSQESALHAVLQMWLYEKGVFGQESTPFTPCQESILDFAGFPVDHFAKYLEIKRNTEEGRRQFEEKYRKS
jgi:hypothetical protein